MKTVRASRWSLALGVLLGVGGTLAVQAGIGEAEAGKGKTAAQLDRQEFHDSIDIVLDRYVEPVDSTEVMSRGLKHMVAGLDGYSHYLTADERELAKKRQGQGAESGLVTTLRRTADRTGDLEVVAVLPNSPAAKLGIGPGTRIIALRDRQAAQLLSNAEAQLLLSGAVGEQVSLTIDRGHGLEQLQLELDRPDAAGIVVSRLLSHDEHAIGLIEIHSFRAGTGERVKRALNELRSKAGAAGLTGLIIDVRGNPGGEVDEALVVADLFVAEGVLTRTRGRGGVILREELATAAGSDLSTPLVLLQDRRSASAAELLAIALVDHGRAKIMGERSFGKGTVQEIIGIPDGSLLTLTVARYFSPKDRSIDGRGVEPDVVLEDVNGQKGLDAAQRELLSRVR